jgi:hypothetical protein
VLTVDAAPYKKKGGYTKITELFDKWKTEIALRDFHLWPSDQIIDLLANHPKIRQHFAAWVTPGDVLTAILSELLPVDRDFCNLIPRALKRRVAADQFVPLNEAGSVGNVKLATSKVFIDLPVQIEVLSGGGSGSGTGLPGQELPGFVRSLIGVAKCRLDPAPLPEVTPEDENRGKLPSRIVLLGGPGQGKSTSGLFAVQILRAAILHDDPSSVRWSRRSLGGQETRKFRKTSPVVFQSMYAFRTTRIGSVMPGVAVQQFRRCLHKSLMIWSVQLMQPKGLSAARTCAFGSAPIPG